MCKSFNAGKGFIFFFIFLQWTFGGYGQSTAIGNQLLQKSFKTTRGTVICNLPGEIVKGDRVWMTVTAEAFGNSAKKMEQNAHFLASCRVKIGDNVFDLSEGGAQFILPDQAGISSIHLELTDLEGKMLGKANIPFSDIPSFTLPAHSGQIHPVVPQVAEKGFPGRMAGNFDGDASTTYLMIGDQEAEIIAESPRECWFRTPGELSGIQKYSLWERDQLFLGEIRLIDLALTASRTNLRKGEKTTIFIAVSGLDKQVQPVNLKIENLTPGILELEDGAIQNLEILPSSIPESGIWQKTLSGQSLTTGEFVVQVQIVPPPPAFIMPVSPLGTIPPDETLVFNWQVFNLPGTSSFSLSLYKGNIPPELLPGSQPFSRYNGISGTSFTPGEKIPVPPKEQITWQVTATTPGGIIRGVPGIIQLTEEPGQPKDTIPDDKVPDKDPCKDPWYVAMEEEQCQEIINEVVKPGIDGVRDQLKSFHSKWKNHFRDLSMDMSTFDMRLGMLEFWMGTGKEIEEQAEKVQEFANLIGDGVDKGITAFKEGGEEALKEVVKGVIEDKVMEAEQNAASRLSENLGVLYDLKDIAVRNIGLGIAKGLTGIYPDQKADFYRRALEISITDLSSWISHSAAWRRSNTQPTLQEGIGELNGMLNQLGQIEKDFNKAVSEAGFRCISCKIPADMMKEINKLRMEMEETMRKFGDTIDRITQRLNEALAVVNNKRAYEDVARLGYYQGHSAKKTREIKRVLSDCRNELQEARSVRKH